MKTIKRQAAQGDVMLRIVPASKVPKDVREAAKKGEVVIAHSETGHNHVALPSKGGAIALLEHPTNQLRSYLRVDKGTHVDIVHRRSYDTHETLRMLCKPGDVIEVRRQREWTPEGWRRIED